MKIKLLVEGGAMKPGPALSQQLGPMGINIGQVISDVNESTKDYKGLQVPVEVDVDAGTKEFKIKVFSPPVSGLVKKEIGIEKGSALQGKEKVANASIEQIIAVAKRKHPNMLCRSLKSAVKTVIGTCVSLGILIENKEAYEIEKDVDDGEYDKEINGEITETPPEKKVELEKFFNGLKKVEEIQKKKEKAAKEAEEASKEKPEEVAKESTETKTEKKPK
jgi:large subunit ribosomal protein L11